MKKKWQPDFPEWESLKKLQRIMRLTLLLVFGLCFSVVAKSYSQTKLMDVRLSNATIHEAIGYVEEHSDFVFLYKKEDINLNKRVDVQLTGANIDQILAKVLKDEKVTYDVYDRQIVIRKAETEAIAAQQKKSVSGKVTDDKGQTLPGVSIVVKGTTTGVVTDANGGYAIQNIPADAILQFSFVGMQMQEVATNGKANINVVLAEETVGIEEVVAIGYGTVKKSDLTGAVASLKKDDMNKGVVTSMSGLLQGKAAGVQITQGSAEPGGGITIQIRGAGSVNAGSEPLYVVDGLPIEIGQVISGVGANITDSRVPRSPISNINTADIQSIEILKDASATAIYGARGANGVILVTTKKGATGAMKVNYSGYGGMQKPINMISVLNASEYKRVLNEILATPGSNVSQTELVGEIQNNGAGTVWQEELIRDAKVQSHSLSFNGGNNTTKYFASLNYFNQEGIMINSGFQRYDTRFNMEHRAEKMLFGINFSTAYTYDDLLQGGFDTNEQGDPLYAARGFDPTLSVFNADGTYQTSPLLNIDNPVALANGERSQAANYRTLGTIFGEYTILKGWTAKVNIGFDMRNSRRDDYVSRITKDGLANGGVGTILTGSKNNYLGEFTTTYNKELKNNSNFTVMGGITYQKFANSDFAGTGKGFPVDETMTNNMGLANSAYYTMTSSKSNNKLLSYIGRANYNLGNKFLFTATIRADGSSKFGENNKFAYFPSAAFAWKMTDYKFIQNLDLFSSLKFRSSIGQTGNQNIANFLSITTFGRGSNVIIGGQQYVGLVPLRIANPDLKWETTQQFDVGFDMGFLNNRITASVDYYQKNTYDMLFALPIPASTGYSSVMQNIGSLKNNGFELTIDSRNLEGKFKWNTSFNLSTLKNEVTDIGTISEIIHTGAGQTTSQIAIIRVGETLNSFYGYQTNGIWQTQADITASGTKDPVKPGDIKYVDQNGDKVVNTSDRVILGKSIPSVTIGLTNNLSFKNFELNFFIDALSGVKMLNNSKVETYFPVSHRRNRIAEPYLNRWTSTNPSTEFPSFVNPAGQGNKAVSDLTVEDASYIRLQSMQLTYRLPLKSKKIFENVAFYVSGQNLHTWTKYTGQDPTTNSNGNSTLKIDFNSYPVARTFIFGVELGF